jgi:membrane-bound ClpP family serine protease
MIILGVVLICVGLLVPKLAVLFTIGIILLVLGVVLFALGQTGHPVGGRTWW